MKRLFLFFWCVVQLFSSSAFCEEAQVHLYPGGTVLLIDHDTGSLGVSFYDSKNRKGKKMAFNVDSKSVRVIDQSSRPLGFKEIAVGDFIDVYMVSEPDGTRVVAEIVNFTRMAEEPAS